MRQITPDQAENLHYIVIVVITHPPVFEPTIGVILVFRGQEMLANCDLAIDLTIAIRDDMKGYAEIARPIDLITVAIPGTPKTGFGILPVINELHDRRLGFRHTPRKLLM